MGLAIMDDHSSELRETAFVDQGEFTEMVDEPSPQTGCHRGYLSIGGPPSRTLSNRMSCMAGRRTAKDRDGMLCSILGGRILVCIKWMWNPPNWGLRSCFREVGHLISALVLSDV
jgi:hypothetical protein